MVFSVMDKKHKKLLSIASTILATLFIIAGTIVVVLYARGYRFDQDMGVIDRTGVLNIESDPYRTTIQIDGKEVGKTPKSINSLKEGTYSISITKDGYTPWSKNVKVIAEKSTPIYPHLFLLEPQLEDVFKLDNQIVDLLHPDRTDYIFIVTRKDIPGAPEIIQSNPEGETTAVPSSDPQPQPTATPEGLQTYRIWRYETNPSFWGTSQNPKLIYEKDLTGVEQFDLLPSPNGEYAVLTVSSAPISEVVGGETAAPEPTVPETEVLLIDTSVQNDLARTLDLNGFLPQYEMSWSADNQFLLLESDTEIVSVEIANNRKYLLKKLADELVWSTTPDGNFYYIDSEVDEDGNKYMKIMETALTGSSPSVLVDRIYYQDSNEFLPDEETLLNYTEPRVFSNSPATSQFAGEITQFWVEDNVEKIIINTEFAMYMYDMTTNMYTLVNSTPGVYYGISPDSEKFLFTHDEHIHVYIFDKEEADHTTILGNHLVLSDITMSDSIKNSPDTITPNDNEGDESSNNGTDVSDADSTIETVTPKVRNSMLQWQNSSRQIFFTTEDRLYSIEIDGENMFDLLDADMNFFVKDTSGDHIFLLDLDSTPNKIFRATLSR